MRETYDKVKRDTGKGSFERMKAVMEKGVENASRKMYNEAAACVKNELTTLQVGVVSRWTPHYDSDMTQSQVF